MTRCWAWKANNKQSYLHQRQGGLAPCCWCGLCSRNWLHWAGWVGVCTVVSERGNSQCWVLGKSLCGQIQMRFFSPAFPVEKSLVFSPVKKQFHVPPRDLDLTEILLSQQLKNSKVLHQHQALGLTAKMVWKRWILSPELYGGFSKI